MIKCSFALDNPGIALFHNVLESAACNYLIERAQDRLIPSKVVSSADKGYEEAHDGRTSYGACFKRGETPEIEAIERRIAALTMSPYENGEGLQLLRYEKGQRYLPHHDYFDPVCEGSIRHLGTAGQRVFSVIMYLNDDFKGGETEFPLLSLLIPPIRGSALVFRNIAEFGDDLDTKTLHGGRPPIEGTKYIATKWIRQRPYFI